MQLEVAGKVVLTVLDRGAGGRVPARIASQDGLRSVCFHRWPAGAASFLRPPDSELVRKVLTSRTAHLSKSDYLP